MNVCEHCKYKCQLEKIFATSMKPQVYNVQLLLYLVAHFEI